MSFKNLPPDIKKPNMNTQPGQLSRKELQERNNKKMSLGQKGLSFLKGLLPKGWQRMVMYEISNGLKADGITDAVVRTDANGVIQVKIKMDGDWFPEVPLIDAFSFKETDMKKLMYDKFPDKFALPPASNNSKPQDGK
jgi:hypothetical protein